MITAYFAQYNEKVGKPIKMSVWDIYSIKRRRDLKSQAAAERQTTGGQRRAGTLHVTRAVIG